MSLSQLIRWRTLCSQFLVLCSRLNKLTLPQSFGAFGEIGTNLCGKVKTAHLTTLFSEVNTSFCDWAQTTTSVDKRFVLHTPGPNYITEQPPNKLHEMQYWCCIPWIHLLACWKHWNGWQKEEILRSFLKWIARWLYIILIVLTKTNLNCVMLFFNVSTCSPNIQTKEYSL